MKNLSNLIVWPVLLAALFAYPSPATAQSQYYWDATSPIHASPGAGGTGNWNTTAGNTVWWVSGSSDSIWANGNSANFAGTAGTVTVNTAVTADGITFTTAGYTLAGSSTLTLAGSTPTVTIPVGTTTVNTKLAGSAGLKESLSGSSGTLTLGGANTYTGGTTIPAGATLQITAAAGAGASSGTIADNGTLTVTITNSSTQTITNAVTGGSSSVVNINNYANVLLSGSYAGFAGTINCNASPGGNAGYEVLVESAAPLSSTETWNVAAGQTLVITFGATALNPSTIILNSPGNNGRYGALQYSGANQFDYSARFSTAAGQKYIFDVNGQSVTFATPLTGSGGELTLSDTTGGGTLTLSGANTYSGGTTVSAGTLDVSATGSLAGNVTVTNAGTLELDNNTALASTATLKVAASGATVNLIYAGTQTITALFIGGIQQAPGVYGAGAYNPGGLFTGSGTLTITTGGGSSPITISAPTISANQLTICWTSVPGADYNVYTTTSLSPPITWTRVNSSPIPATGTSTCYTLPGSVVGQPQLFVNVQQ
jgi:autotransporter-associated beta strand protein